MAKYYIVVPFNDMKGRKVADHATSFLVNPCLVFSNAATANIHAEALAAKTCGVDVMVFECTGSVVATTPKITRKVFSAEGEMVPKAAAF